LQRLRATRQTLGEAPVFKLPSCSLLFFFSVVLFLPLFLLLVVSSPVFLCVCLFGWRGEVGATGVAASTGLEEDDDEGVVSGQNFLSTSVSFLLCYSFFPPVFLSVFSLFLCLSSRSSSSLLSVLLNLSILSRSLPFFCFSSLCSWPFLAFIKPEDGLCWRSCVRASRSWGTNALKKQGTVQRGLLKKIMGSWGDVHGRRGSERFWFPVESVPGLEKVMNSGSKRRRLYLGNGYFSLWSLNVLNLTIGILISNNQFVIVPLD